MGCMRVHRAAIGILSAIIIVTIFLSGCIIETPKTGSYEPIDCAENEALLWRWDWQEGTPVGQTKEIYECLPDPDNCYALSEQECKGSEICKPVFSPGCPVCQDIIYVGCYPINELY